MASTQRQSKPNVIAWLNVSQNGIALEATIDRDTAEEQAEEQGNAVVGLCCEDDTRELIDAKDREIADLRKSNAALLKALQDTIASAKRVYIKPNSTEMYLVDAEVIAESRKLVAGEQTGENDVA